LAGPVVAAGCHFGQKIFKSYESMIPSVYQVKKGEKFFP